MYNAIINVSYLIAAVLFIFGLKGLTHPRTAVRGNKIGSVGMLIAIVVTMIDQNIISYEYILMGIVIGGLVGAVAAIKIEMTSMPEMVALFNGFGGAASVLVAGAAIIEAGSLYASGSYTGTNITQLTIATVLSGIIGTICLLGSLVAFGKLKGIITGNAVLIPGRHVINALLLVGTLALGYMLVLDPANANLYWMLVGIGAVLGVSAVIPIGGADMPVVISLLNSYSGLAAAATGFVLDNNGLIIAGSLVGASGLILTQIMCVAMNRSLSNVLFGVLGPTEGGPSDDEVYAGKVKATSGDECAMLLEDAQKVVIIPGYGMAVSQAQHAVRDLYNILEERGTTVEFAVHPVAGRMPGHMNVLLAEADIPYEKLIEMDIINSEMDQCDVAIVIGANDVVNPVARTDPQSPIAGMPIIDVDKARTVVVIKRSLSPGFAGIPNPLFALDNSLMFFADGKQAFVDMINAMKEL